MLTPRTTYPGHFCIHCVLGVAVSAKQFLVVSCSVEIIVFSISSSHFSTLPFLSPSFTSIGLFIVTFSFSDEIIAPTSDALVKSSSATPSKHLLMCFYTFMGSFVSARISSSSSSERKKNRGKSRRLDSKYSERLF